MLSPLDKDPGGVRFCIHCTQEPHASGQEQGAWWFSSSALAWAGQAWLSPTSSCTFSCPRRRGRWMTEVKLGPVQS